MNKSIKESLAGIDSPEREHLLTYIEELENKLKQQDLQLADLRNKDRASADGQGRKEKVSLQQLLFSLPGGVCLYDFKVNKLLAVNEKFCEIFRYPTDRIDTPLFFTIFPDTQPGGEATGKYLVDGRNKAVEIGEAQRLKLRFRRVDGEELPGEVTIVPDTAGADTVYLIFRDHSKADAQRKALIKSERRYREFIELAPVGICKVDTYGRILQNSATADKILGYDRGDNIGNSIINLVHPDDKGVYAEKVMNLIKGEDEVVFSEVRILTREADFLWLRGAAKLHVDKDGIPQYLLIAFMDIGELKEAETLLKEREAIYRAVVGNAMEGIDIADVSNFHPVHNPQGDMLIRNERMKRLYQSEDELYTTVESISKIVPAFQPSGERSEAVFNRIVQQLYKQGKSEEVLRFQHDEDLYFDIEAVQQMLEIGDKKLLVRIYHDITNRVQQEQLIQQQLEQLNEQNQELQTYIESNMQLENFAYIASHDLRAPIRSIVSFASLLEKRLGDRLNESEKDYLDFISKSAISMQALIEDLLTFSRANTVKRELQPVSLTELRQDMEVEFQSQLQEASGQLHWDNFDHTITADPIKFRQLLQNLISNALKFTNPELKPEVRVSLQEKSEEWMFAVQDNGIGIAEEFQNTIFLIFKRLHNIEEYDGTGIGLALCRKLVEQHEGRIWVESVEGEGSAFFFTVRKNLKD